ncbi:MAG: hypothetical protein OEY67_05180, partial [Gammaproteobacteria bacterium]|nr:hypothetical protein [Gammaproteobacteria bacterium]
MKPKNIGKSIFIGLALSQTPAALAITGKIYVAAESTSNIVVVDAATNSIITNVDTGVGTAPHNPVVSPDNQYVWVTLKTTQ